MSVQHRGAYDVLTAHGELRCDVPRRLVHEAETHADLPVVGDWVVVAPRPEDGAGTITAVLPRFTKFSRKTAWQATEEQVLAANIDVAFLVASMNEDLSLRRLERYLILAWESGARPVIVLTKADLHAAPEAAVAEVETIAGGVPGRSRSRARRASGSTRSASSSRPGLTAVLLGSSGVGKSTLVNTLAGEELLATQEIRDDGKGRHTTTRRELIQLPGGALVIDTPGIRELQLWVADDGIDEAFEDVTTLFALVQVLRLRARSRARVRGPRRARRRLAVRGAVGELPQAAGGARAPRAEARQARRVRRPQEMDRPLQGRAREHAAEGRIASGRRGWSRAVAPPRARELTAS